MPDRPVTAHARDGLGAASRVRPGDGLRDLRVAFLTSLLGDLQVAFLDLDRLVEAASGEIERMPEAVRSLRRVFIEEICRRMAIVASRHRSVRRLEPAVVLLGHDVAVGARGRIVGQVRRAFGVYEGVDAQAHRRAYQNTHNQTLKRALVQAAAPYETSNLCCHLKSQILTQASLYFFPAPSASAKEVNLP